MKVVYLFTFSYVFFFLQYSNQLFILGYFPSLTLCNLHFTCNIHVSLSCRLFPPFLIIRATNETTPKCSPLPSRSRDPVDILVPRDITDPLNLKEEGRPGGGAQGVLLSPLKSRRRHRNHHGGDKEAVNRPIFPSTDGLTGEAPAGMHTVQSTSLFPWFGDLDR